MALPLVKLPFSIVSTFIYGSFTCEQLSL